MAHRPSNTNFSDSQEAVFRRHCRDAAKRGPFSKGERDVVLAVLNLWFVHRKKDGGVFHPGRTKLARRAGVSVRTVASTLAMLRDAGVMQTVSHAKGGWGKATRYTFDVIAYFPACGFDYPAFIPGDLVVQNCTHSRPPIAHNMRAKIAHGISNPSESAFANDVDDAFPPLRLIAGGAK